MYKIIAPVALFVCPFMVLSSTSRAEPHRAPIEEVPKGVIANICKDLDQKDIATLLQASKTCQNQVIHNDAREHLRNEMSATLQIRSLIVCDINSRNLKFFL